jgi:hypothetical protein
MVYNNIMSRDVLDNWGNLEDFEISTITLNKQQHKIIEERKLAEEADNELTNILFSDTPSIKQENKNDAVLKQKSKKTLNLKAKSERNKATFDKTKKDLSININNRNQAQKKQKDIFGECADKNYVKYCELEEKYTD